MKRIFIKPTKDLFVRNPFNKRLIAPAGEEVNEHSYWLRLEKQGDITISEIKGNKKEVNANAN